jgi:hypothetical protein
MKRGPKPSGKAMTAAQRQARYRAAHAEGAPRLQLLDHDARLDFGDRDQRKGGEEI